MADKKDLFSIFRDHQHQFDTPPSPRAWDKLERRLDGHRRRNRLSMLRNFSMAAAVLLLAVITVLVSMALGEKPGRFLNQSPAPLASEQLQTDNVEAAEELRQTQRTQRAEQQRQQPINEGPADRKIVLAKKREASSALESVAKLYWLEGNWQAQDSRSHGAVNWVKIKQHAIEGQIEHEGQTEHFRIFQEGATLFFSTDFGQGQRKRFALQYATPNTAVFEREGPVFPKKIILSRTKHNRLVLLYEQDKENLKSGVLSRKQKVRKWYKIQLQ